MAQETAGSGVAAPDCSGDLAQRLARMFSGVARKRVVVGFCDGVDTHFAAIGGAGDRAGALAWTFPVGCVTKLLTGALIEIEVDAGRIALDEPVAPLLRADGEGARVLAGVTLRMLLEHTHGLDASACVRLALDTSGRIHAPLLLANLGATRLASPGRRYSYSNAGAWIAAAVLERLSGLPFPMLLRVRLLEPLGVTLGRVRVSPGSGSATCPATGGGLLLSAPALVKCVRWMAERWPRRAQGDVTALPGWNPLERGVWRGWKCYDHGWLGHQSVAPAASVLVRVHRERNLAVVLASRHHHATIVAAKLFAGVLPELVALRLPKPFPPDAAAGLDAARYRGQYGTAAERLSVETRDGRTLRLVSPSAERALVPAQDQVFYVQPEGIGQLAFVQFVGRTGQGFHYLWDSRCVLRRKIHSDEPD